MVGSTSSADFPVTAAAFDRSANGAFDAFVTRLNSSGSALVYSTFLGGSGFDSGSGLINVATGSSGTASFSTGTSITLSVTNGRDAIWSGACSSSGSKRKTCTFTLNAAASVSANVQ
jgi:hypothetical protein